MAIIKNGVLGGFSGKVGNIVGSSWRGIAYVRSLPRRSKKEPSEKQLAHRMKFKLAFAFVNPIRALINLGYRDSKIRYTTAVGQLLGTIMQTAVVGEYPDLKLDPKQIKISRGSLPDLLNLKLSVNSQTEFTISWAYDPEKSNGQSADRVVGLIYDERIREFAHLEEIERFKRVNQINIPLHLESDNLHFWVFCYDKQTGNVSNSQYFLVNRV